MPIIKRFQPGCGKCLVQKSGSGNFNWAFGVYKWAVLFFANEWENAAVCNHCQDQLAM